jgi:hypothetical protein
VTIIREFGGIQLILAVCINCGEEGFVIDGKCGVCFSPIKIKKESLPIVKESGGSAKRKSYKIPKPVKGICTYCKNPIGSSILMRGKKEIVLRAEWDHFVPFGFSGSDKTEYVLSCHICNGIKYDIVFSSLKEAQNFIRKRWDRLGHIPLKAQNKKEKDVSKEAEEGEEVMEGWSIEFDSPAFWYDLLKE